MIGPRFASALSTDPDLGVAQQRCVAELLEGLGGETPDLVLVFASIGYGDHLRGLGQRLSRATDATHIAGCTGAGIVGGAREVEQKPALSLFGARLPDCRVSLAPLRAEEQGGRWAFRADLRIEDPGRCGLLVLGDPFTFPAPEFLSHVAERLPGVPVVGGLASGSRTPGRGLILAGDDDHPAGGVAVIIEGEVQLHPVVSQGCRPIGEPFVVTSARDNVVMKLGGRGAAHRMIDMLEALASDERALFQRGAFVGLAVDPTKSRFEAGDLLVRGVVGVDPDKDLIAIAGRVRAGQTLHFMVRDAASASAEIESLLDRRAAAWGDLEGGAAGALLFTCGGRGSHMFRTLHHDASAIQAALGPRLPLAGMFAGGEIGPVAGTPFLHGFTASMGFLIPRSRE